MFQAVGVCLCVYVLVVFLKSNVCFMIYLGLHSLALWHNQGRSIPVYRNPKSYCMNYDKRHHNLNSFLKVVLKLLSSVCRSESKGVWGGHLQLLARTIIISCSGSRLAYDAHWVLKDFLLMGIHNLNGSDVESSMPVDRSLLCWQATQSLVPSTSWGDFLISLNLNQGMFLD